MSKIQFLTDLNKNIGSSSGVINISFISSEKILSYKISLLNSEDITYKTSLIEDYDNIKYPEKPYHYEIYYYYDENRSVNYNVKKWGYDLNILFKNDITEYYNGTITQSGNPNASYIKNIKVYDNENNILNKDIYGRFVIPSKYTGGTVFTIRFDSSYPPYPNTYPNANISSIYGAQFIESITESGLNFASFEINSVITNTKVNTISLDYDDSYAVGNSFTEILFVREGVEPAKITTDTSEISNIPYIGGAYNVGITLVNISPSEINISASEDWISTYFSDNNLNIGINANMDEYSEKRSGYITISGVNSKGMYAEAIIYISQVAYNQPYIGDAVEQYLALDGTLYPQIRVNYNGEVVKETSQFTLYNVIDDLLDNIVESVMFYEDGEPTDFLHYDYIEGEPTGKIYSNDKYKTNSLERETLDFFDVEIILTTGSTINTVIAVVVNASPENIVGPVWKDHYFECPTRYFRLRNLLTKETIYNGMVYPEASNIVRINDIIKNYILINRYPFENTISFNNCMMNVLIETSNLATFEEYTEFKIYHLYWNYSYNYLVNPSDIMGGYTPGYTGTYSGLDIDGNFANPIEYYDPRQYMFITVPQSFEEYNQTSFSIYGKDSDTGQLTKLEHLDKNKFIGDLCTFTIAPGFYDNIMLEISPLPDYDYGYNWECGKLKCTKANYAVYYLNNSGIWCWMLFEGKQMESLKTSLNKILTNEYNDVSYHIHNETYQNSIEEYYNLTSIHLNDKQSKMLKDLYTSPLIFVHELDNNVIYNVYLNTTSMDIKTYNNQGKKRFTHNIKLTKSINKEIRI